MPIYKTQSAAQAFVSLHAHAVCPVSIAAMHAAGAASLGVWNYLAKICRGGKIGGKNG